jgi:DNA primase
LEGYMDVLVTHQFGVSQTVATLGTSLTAQHAQMLSRYADDVTLLFDSDDAGFAAAKRATDILLDKDIALKISSLPDGVDPDEYLVEHGTEAFNALVEKNRQSAIEFLTAMAIRKHGIASPEAKSRVVQELIPVVARAQNAVLVGEWIKYIAGQAGIAESAIVSEVKRTRVPARSVPREAAPVKRTAGIRSAEEELIQLIAAFPPFAAKVDERMFCDERCKTVFQLLAAPVTVAEIATRLPEPLSQWFMELALEEKIYAAPDEVLQTLVHDLEQRRRELRRQELGRDIILMESKKKPLDEEIVRQYNELNTQLKGSVKSRHGKNE